MSELLLVEDVAVLVGGTPMDDVACLGGYADATFGETAAISLVGDGIALAVDLGEGGIDGVVDLEFEDEYVVLGLDDDVGTAEDAPDLGIDDGVEHGEGHVEEEFVERFAAFLVVPFLTGDDVVGYLGDIGAEGDEGVGDVAVKQGVRHAEYQGVTIGGGAAEYAGHQSAHHAVAHFEVGKVQGVCVFPGIVAVDGEIAALIEQRQGCFGILAGYVELVLADQGSITFQSVGEGIAAEVLDE